MTNQEEKFADFDYWIVDMDDALEGFIDTLPSELAERLDYTPASLNFLEAWILSRYPSTDAMLPHEQAQSVDKFARYIGETFRKAIGGYWSQDEIPDSPYYGLPVLQNIGGTNLKMCPLTLATASADRRNGSYLFVVLQNYMKKFGKI